MYAFQQLRSHRINSMTSSEIPTNSQLTSLKSMWLDICDSKAFAQSLMSSFHHTMDHPATLKPEPPIYTILSPRYSQKLLTSRNVTDHISSDNTTASPTLTHPPLPMNTTYTMATSSTVSRSRHTVTRTGLSREADGSGRSPSPYILRAAPYFIRLIASRRSTDSLKATASAVFETDNLEGTK